MTVFGLGVEYGWSEGPYPVTDSPTEHPIGLPPEAAGPGLVQVFVRLEVTAPDTGALRAVQGAPPVYVDEAGLPGEAWYDAATAERLAVRDPVTDPLAGADDAEIDGIVGLEVSR